MYDKESIQKLVKQKEALSNLLKAAQDFKFYILEYAADDDFMTAMELEKFREAILEGNKVLN